MIELQCPIPISDYPVVTLAHGGGGRLSQLLIERMFVPAFANAVLETLHDGAVLELNGARLAFSTDSFTVSPLFFPGGDIGSLAVYGTVNDLAMCGARPLALAVGFILEEGLPMEELWRVIVSMQRAAVAVGVPIVTGDTKVVERGKGDGIFINTTGVGVVLPGVHIAPQRAVPGDRVLINGSIAEHGIAIMAQREGLAFETELVSDSAPLLDLVLRVLEVGGEHVHVLRDPTRGGVASALNEIAAKACVGIRLDEERIPVTEAVRGACEILGFDPLYVANEGKCIAIVAPEVADHVLETMRAHPQGAHAACIGEVVPDHPGKVFMRSRIGGLRVVDMLSGEQLPRIC
ncbi:MAG: hydrogenase expression/formation protein HypE [Anaerolineae bacterium]|nr:hydrogenase expression/formation protein HypE [Anaerolineae bacterium]MDW8070638.1 hydrogenase expression/formation protein HypE [Anaerolineae bacterium]